MTVFARTAWLALVAMLLAQPAAAQTKIRYLLTSPSPGVAEAPHSSVPEALGFWKDAGLDVTVTPFNGSTGATQVVISGSAEFTMASPEALLVGRQGGADIRAVYNHAREPIYTIAVVKQSSVQNLADLKGKTIGVVSLSSGATAVAKAMLRGIGLDPEKDVKWLPIGLGPQSAAALKANQVDAIAMWDWAYAILENSGFQFRHFETEGTSKLLSIMLIGNGAFIKDKPDAVVAFAEGIAKSVVFTLANPEAAVRLHWARYPASKPANIPEDQALREAVHVLESRIAKYKLDGRADPRFGAFTADEWKATQAFFFDVGMINAKPDVSAYYTNTFVDRIDHFDKAAIARKAEAYR
ncbi:ABC transporter substrate-binding protein [Rhodopseudomonas sp. HC1]|uniref:ABC transporter substrate-binding protein n=1 Tax=Rhodopseudomonas infernalis TaxID=2897386 RepID=UPI001EE8B22A|nr:ABC transporter substrate-binding protein [Rhodopseudomonas infernalis]MCG6207726.1 ABC transporter substrate-binding protein [Rhodopseudomonas infernalis]